MARLLFIKRCYSLLPGSDVLLYTGVKNWIEITLRHQIPGEVLILCLVALACDVKTNLSSKGRREHIRQFSAITMILFWIFAAGHASMHIVISEVSRTFEYKLCLVDPVKQETAHMMNLLHRFMHVCDAC